MLLLIIVCIILCAGGLIAWLVTLGIVVLLVILLLFYSHYLGRKEKIQLQRVEHIHNTYDLAFQKFKSEHNAQIEYKEWDSKLRELFLTVKDDEWATIQNLEEKRIADEKAYAERIDKRFKDIEDAYPVGLEYWFKKNNYYLHERSKRASVAFNITTNKPFKVIEKEEVIAAFKQIQTYDIGYLRIKAFSGWKEEQRQFSRCLLGIVNSVIPKRSAVTLEHTVDFTIPDVEDEDGKTVISFFHTYFQSFCLDASIDYSLYPKMKFNSEYIIKGFRREQSTIDNLSIEEYYEYYNDVLLNIISSCFEGIGDDSFLKELSVVFFDDIHDYKVDPSLFGIIRDSFSTRFGESDKCTVYQLNEVLSHNAPSLKKNVVIIGHVTNSSNLIEQCSQILSLYPDILPHLYYFSIYQEINSEVMRRSIETKKASIAADEERKRQEISLLESIPQKVQNWESLQGSLRIKYIIYYYPTTVDFMANDEEWDNRRLVWDFKNDPDKTSEENHRHALNKVIPKFATILSDTFGKEVLHHLTLVCIPASTQEKNQSRYKLFAEELCQETGMENGFQHTVINLNRTAKHDGGKNSIDNYSFDGIFFKGKRVVLFDDIITKGDSMRIAKAKLESVGATVICGLAIGKTCHEHR